MATTRYGHDGVGQRLRMARLARRISQREAAAVLGFTHAALSDVERGKSAITLENLCALAAFYGVSPQSIVPEIAAPALHRSPQTKRTFPVIFTAEQLREMLIDFLDYTGMRNTYGTATAHYWAVGYSGQPLQEHLEQQAERAVFVSTMDV